MELSENKKSKLVKLAIFRLSAKRQAMLSCEIYPEVPYYSRSDFFSGTEIFFSLSLFSSSTIQKECILPWII